MPSCDAALRNGDCCGWEQGELITLLFEAWAAQVCCASFENDKRLSEEHGFVLQHRSFARLNHRRLLRFCLVFFILGLCSSLGSAALFSDSQTLVLCCPREGDWSEEQREGDWSEHQPLARKGHGGIALSTVPEQRLQAPRHLMAPQHGRGFAKRKFISKPPPSPGDFAFSRAFQHPNKEEVRPSERAGRRGGGTEGCLQRVVLTQAAACRASERAY